MKTGFSIWVLYLMAIIGFRTWGSVPFARDFAALEGLVKPVEQPYRQEMCLNGRWQFQPVPVPAGYRRNQGIPPELPPPGDAWESTLIRIPSPWNANTYNTGRKVGSGTEHPYWPDSVWFPSYPASWDGVEMGWLRRTFQVPRGWDGKRVLLHFQAVAGGCRVLVNGRP
jgi:beta-galactosidase